MIRQYGKFVPRPSRSHALWCSLHQAVLESQNKQKEVSTVMLPKVCCLKFLSNNFVYLLMDFRHGVNWSPIKTR